MTPNSTVVLVAVAGPLGLILLIVILLGGGASSGSAQLTSATSAPELLSASAVPNASWVPWIEQAGGLCPDITAPVIAAQDFVESTWNPNAVSLVGAEGIAQFMRSTWPVYDSPPAVPGPDTPFNVPDAIMAQGRLDCALVAAVGPLAQQTGIPALTLALDAYNAGLSRGHSRRAGFLPNPQTEGYAPAIEQLATTTYAEVGSSPDGTGTGNFASAR